MDWTPHPKSMTLQKLASHVATMPEWFHATLAADELDFATAKPPPDYKTRSEMLEGFDASVAKARTALAAVKSEQWQAPWTVRQGPQVIHSASRYKIYRVWDMNHLIHHRGQLNLYLRLLNVPVATIYFNSADEPEWKFE
jgi:uncharacterized damage-inducible protein DinB